MGGCFEKNCANALIVYEMFIVCSYLSGSIGIVRKNVTKDAVMVCICIIIITHTIFFIIIAPVSHYRGTPRFMEKNTLNIKKISFCRNAGAFLVYDVLKKHGAG